MARKRLRKSGGALSPRRMLLKAAVLGLLLITLLAAIAGLYYYGKFTRLIQTRLQVSPPVKTAIYSRPFRVRGGRRVPAEPRFISNLYGATREKQRYVPFEDLPEPLVKAVLAAEDEHFFSHPGLDWWALLRAAVVNTIRWRPVQGGSTLTQQFVKNYFLTPEKSLMRKVEEIWMAVLLENRLSKKQIFELYANEVYLGQAGSFAITGFGQAAATYFGKDVGELALHECALLAGIIQAPNRYWPYRNSKAAANRRNYVLDLMEKKGFISAAQNDEARGKPLRVVPLSQQNYNEAPYFVDYVREISEKRFGIRAEGVQNLEVYTTLDPELQKAAFLAIQEGMREVDQLLARRKRAVHPQVALMAVAPRTGEILAMVGGRDYARSQYDRAVHARRQPGSTFKPFVYAAALQSSLNRFEGLGYTLSSVLVDEPYTLTFEEKTYSPGNYGERYHGPVTLRQALALSLNVPTVKVAQSVGFDRVVYLSREMGLPEGIQPYPSVALGTFEVSLFELAQAYTAFANSGSVAPLYAVSEYKIDDVREQAGEPSPKPALYPQVAFLITSALESAVNEGTGKAVRVRGFSLPAAGKTGTSEDGWFVGYTPELLCAVWVGLDDSSPLGLTGTQAGLPVWTDFMLRVQRLGYLSGNGFAIPDNVVAVEIDAETGLRASRQCREIQTEYYIVGTEPTEQCSGELPLEMMVEERRVHEKPRRGFWGWFKGLFRQPRKARNLTDRHGISDPLRRIP